MIQILFKFKVQQHRKPVLLFIKGQLIWASHGRVITFRVLHDLQKTWKIAQNMYIMQHHWRGQMIPILFIFRVEQHPKPVLLFIKGQLICAAHGRVITFRVLHYLQKTWKNSTKICKFCNIIEEARWYKFCLNLKYSNILSQCCYLSKRNSFEQLIAELSPFESYTIYKKREKLHKICKFCNIIEEARWYKFCLNLE